LDRGTNDPRPHQDLQGLPHRLVRLQDSGVFVTGLQFDVDVWYLFFEWTTRYEGEYPSVRFPIDPSLLVPSPDQGHDFLLQEPVEIPMSTRMTDLLSRHRKLRTD